MLTKTPDEIRRQIEHGKFLEDLREVLKDQKVRDVFKYLLRELRLAQYPELGAQGVFLHEELGYLKTSKVIFDHLCEADPYTAAMIFTMIRKDENEHRRQIEMDEKTGPSAE